jgi:hypothetical protein
VTAKSALVETTVEAEPSAWQPMSSAPKDRSILLRSTWGGELVAVVGRWAEVHGCHCTLPIYGHDRHQIFATGWHDLPSLDGAI